MEPAPNGSMYLLNKNYASRSNVNNTPGWYLSMSLDGVLSSNGYKCELSQWALVAANQQAAVYQNSHYQVAPPAAAVAPTHTHTHTPAHAPQAQAQAQTAEPPPPPPAGSDIEMQPVTSYQYNPLFANRELPAERPVSPPAASPPAASPPVSQPSTVAAAAVIVETAPRPMSMTRSNTTAVVGTVAAPPVRPPLTQSYSMSTSTASSAMHLFAGHDAGRDALMKFFLTPTGVTFLQQPQYADSLKLYTAGSLAKILHR